MIAFLLEPERHWDIRAAIRSQPGSMSCTPKLEVKILAEQNVPHHKPAKDCRLSESSTWGSELDSNCRYRRGGKINGDPLFWRTVAAVRVLARTSISTAAGAGISTASRTCIGTPTGAGVCASARTCISTAPRPCVGTPTWAGICSSTRPSISTAAGARISAASRTCIGTPTGAGVCASARTCVAVAGPCGLILGNCG